MDEEKQMIETDPFSDFLFGPRRRPVTEAREKDGDYDWILGRRSTTPNKLEDSEESILPGPIEATLKKVNIPELLTHLDTLMNSAQNLKPLYGDLKPLVKQFLKK